MRLVKTLLALLALTSVCLAQSSPGFVTGQTPTAAQWNGYFAAKTDYPPPTQAIAQGAGINVTGTCSGPTLLCTIAATNTGTVTSVALTAPAQWTVTGSPITGTGTLGLTIAAQTAPTNNFANGRSTADTLTFAQPAFSNLSGSATNSQLPGTGNITISSKAYQLAGTYTPAFVNVATATAPTGTASTTGVMMGLGSTWKFTPTTSGHMLLCFDATASLSAVGTFQIGLRFGTGTAPSNGAAPSGTATQVGGGTTVSTAGGVANQGGCGAFTFTVGTAAWVDLQLAATTGGGTAAIVASTMNFSATELP